jgi:hypothetical protein
LEGKLEGKTLSFPKLIEVGEFGKMIADIPPMLKSPRSEFLKQFESLPNYDIKMPDLN